MAKKWYIIQTYSGFENSVKRDLETRRETLGVEDKILQVLCFEDEVIEEVENKKTHTIVQKKKVKKKFPGYLFVELEVEDEIDDRTWFIIRNTPKVTGFLGSSGGGTKPVPVRKEEMEKLLNPNAPTVVENSKVKFSINEHVILPSLGNSEGTISHIDAEKKIATVLVEFMGRAVPYELNFSDIKKIGE